MEGQLVGLRHFRTGVKNRPYAGQTIALDITGVRDVEKVPMELRLAYELMMARLQTALVANYRSFVPGAPMGRLGSHVAARRFTRRNLVVGVFDTPYAAALNRGFTATAKKGKALRFEIDGEVFFRKRVRVAGRRFHEKAIASSGPIVEAIYDAAFYDVTDLA